MAKQLLLTLLSLYLVIPGITFAQLPVNGDFETVVMIEEVSVRSTPIPKLGIWYGDPATVVVAENGITPADGDHMLRFDGDTSNLYQFVRTPAELRGTDVKFEALFNGTEDLSISESNETAIGLASLSDVLVAGSPYPDTLGDHFEIETIAFDTDPQTWESFDVKLSIPDDSQTLMFMLFGNADDGVYADMARLVPEPTSGLLLAIGLVGLCRLRSVRCQSSTAAIVCPVKGRW